MSWKHTHSGEFSREADQRVERFEERERFQLSLQTGSERRKRDLVYDFEGGWFPKVEALLAELPCDVLLVRTPLRSDFIASLPEETWTRYTERVAELQQTHGWKFIDMNEEPWMKSDEDMKDKVHVTPKTRSRLSRILGRRLVKMLQEDPN